MTLKLDHVKRDPKRLRRLELNARYMRKETYDQLVANLREDGVLTQWPLLWAEPGKDEEGAELILSGNHRCDAAVDAGLAEIDATLLIAPDLPAARRIAMQLSHNSIAGDDDVPTLKLLYDEIDDVDWRRYAGLDDKTLDLLDNVEAESLSEANLDYQLAEIMFLPAELDRAKLALDTARDSPAGTVWAAARPQYEAFLDALESARNSYEVGNIATALGVIIDVFEAHLTDLQEGWYDPDTQTATAPRNVPFETILGQRTLPSDAAAVIQQAVARMIRAGDAGKPWQAIERICADWLAQ